MIKMELSQKEIKRLVRAINACIVSMKKVIAKEDMMLLRKKKNNLRMIETKNNSLIKMDLRYYTELKEKLEKEIKDDKNGNTNN